LNLAFPESWALPAFDSLGSAWVILFFPEALYQYRQWILYTPSPFVENVAFAPTTNIRFFNHLRLVTELPSMVEVEILVEEPDAEDHEEGKR
jgi:hypothetical protein